MNEQNEGTEQNTWQKENIAGERIKTVDPPSTTGQASIEQKSEGAGIQGSQCNDSGFSQRGNRSDCDNKPVDGNLGKVLEHLGNLESRFYKYVHAHQERLDLRRKESTAAEQEFQQEVEQLREKIFALLAQKESEPEAEQLEENSEP